MERGHKFQLGRIRNKYIIFEILLLSFNGKNACKHLHCINSDFRLILRANYLYVKNILTKITINRLHELDKAITLEQLKKMKIRVELDRKIPIALFQLKFIDTISLCHNYEQVSRLNKIQEAIQSIAIRKLVVNMQDVTSLYGIFNNSAVFKAVLCINKLEIRLGPYIIGENDQYINKPILVLKIRGQKTILVLVESLKAKPLLYNTCSQMGIKMFVQEVHKQCQRENFKLIYFLTSSNSIDQVKLDWFKFIDCKNKYFEYDRINVNPMKGEAVQEMKEIIKYSTNKSLEQSELTIPLQSFYEIISSLQLPFKAVCVFCDTEKFAHSFLKQPMVNKLTLDLKECSIEKLYECIKACCNVENIELIGVKIALREEVQVMIQSIYSEWEQKPSIMFS
ncbi:hypothetical protein FGO68_gene11148 [Halteria grandinella]|uniref:Uncharacterized protein n=1 Tax=Halteria grandinella TaxID=5974 RepID=A0A8J8NQ48_HALGN|nr:hypothetical protein FGO68_gene11148 [Halteria grandinella]